MNLKVKTLKLETGGPLVVVLNKKDAAKLDIHPLDRLILTKNHEHTTAITNISEISIQEGYIGVYEETAHELNLKDGELIFIKISHKPESLKYIKKKLDGGTLKKEEIDRIIRDLLHHHISSIEATYFVAGCYVHGMTLDESAYLTKAIVDNSGSLKFNKKIVLDKHSIGGLAGNRTTPIVVSILAALGYTIPKTSTRSITSPAGTSDTVEVLMPVTHSREKIMDIVKKTNGCLVWGGTLDLASADDLLIKLEKILDLDPEGILLASIMAKKSAVDSTHIIIDIPVGPDAKIKSVKKAKALENKFIALGKKLDMKVKIMISDGTEPIGNGIGPSLEARDVLLVLEGEGPKDLRNKSLKMSCELLRMVKKTKNCNRIVQECLDSGKALKKLKEIIAAQGGNPNITSSSIQLSNISLDVISPKEGKVKEVNNTIISRIAKFAGAPENKRSGIYLYKKVGDKVKKGEKLYTIYSESESKLGFALHESKINNGFIIQ